MGMSGGGHDFVAKEFECTSVAWKALGTASSNLEPSSCRRAPRIGGLEGSELGVEGGLQRESRGRAILRRISTSRGGVVSKRIVRAVGGRLRVFKHKVLLVASDSSSLSSRLAVVLLSGKPQRVDRQWKGAARRQLSAVGARAKEEARARGRQALVGLRVMHGEFMKLSKRRLAIIKKRGRILVPHTESLLSKKARMLQVRIRVAGKAGLQRCGGVAGRAFSVVMRGGKSRRLPEGQNGTAQQLTDPAVQKLDVVASDPGRSMPGIPSTPPSLLQRYRLDCCPNNQQQSPSMETLAVPRVLDHCGTAGGRLYSEVSEKRPVQIGQETRRCQSRSVLSSRLFQPLLCHAAEAAGAAMDLSPSSRTEGRCARQAEGRQPAVEVSQAPGAADSKHDQMPAGAPQQQESNLSPRPVNRVETDDTLVCHSTSRNEFEQVLKTWQSKELQAVSQRRRGSTVAREHAQPHAQHPLQSNSKSREEPACSPVKKTPAADEQLAEQRSHGSREQSIAIPEAVQQDERPPPPDNFDMKEEEEPSEQSPTHPSPAGRQQTTDNKAIVGEEAPKEVASRRGSEATEREEPLCTEMNIEEEKAEKGVDQTDIVNADEESQLYTVLSMLPTKWEVFGLLLGALFVYVLIFLCTRKAPQAILLLFCCLFGLRIRLGGSGSKDGGSYTALWLLLLQLLVITALCIVSLAKKAQNMNEFTTQLEENKLYTADIRISKPSERFVFGL